MADQAEVEAPQVKGVVQDQFQDWLRHPVTRVFRQYLRDYREALRGNHLQRWEQGGPDPADALGRVLTLAEVADLEFADMLAFYAEDQKEDDE